jgi:hypothetical protein
MWLNVQLVTKVRKFFFRHLHWKRNGCDPRWDRAGFSTPEISMTETAKFSAKISPQSEEILDGARRQQSESIQLANG